MIDTLGDKRAGLVSASLEAESAGLRQPGQTMGEGFEALLIRRLYAAMKSTVPDGGLFGSASGSQMMDYLMESSLAQFVASGGGIGIQRLFDQVESLHHAESSSSDAVGTMGVTTAPNVSLEGLDDGLTPLAMQAVTEVDPWLDSPQAAQILRRTLAESGGE